MPGKSKDDGADPMDVFLDELARGFASGEVQLVSVRANACGKCKVGTMVGDPSPSWMNRATCDRCGARASR